MLKIILPFFIAMIITACSENGVNDSSNTEFMSIARAPAVKGINITQVLAIVFSSEINTNSLLKQTNNGIFAPTLVSVDNEFYPIYLRDSNGSVVPVNISQDTTEPNKLIVTPWRYFVADITYTLVVTTALKDVYGKSLIENYEFSFTPVTDGSNTRSFNVVDANPRLNAQSGIEAKSDISYEFDGKVAYSNVSSPWFIVTDLNNSLVPVVVGTYEYINQKVIFRPTASLIYGHTYDVNFTANSKTDMYGNELNISSALDRNFTVDTNTSKSYIISKQGAVNIGYEGTMVRYFTNVYDDANASNRVQYAAVARSDGIDFYSIDINTSSAIDSTLTKKASLTLEVNSTITDMKYVDDNNSQKLLISTLKDGLFIVNTNDNKKLNITKLLEGEKDIYGVGYGKDSNGLMDAIYAVGPTMGLKTFRVNQDGNISTDKNISISGEPLKVVGAGQGTGAYIYVTDYKNGVQVYNKNGDFNTTVIVPGNVKYLLYTTNNYGQVLVTNSIGNIYSIDPSNPSKSYFYLSTYGSIQDLSLITDISPISIASSNKGNILVNSSSITDAFGGGVNENIVSSFSQSFRDNAQSIFIDFDILLSKEGRLIGYFNGSGAK